MTASRDPETAPVHQPNPDELIDNVRILNEEFRQFQDDYQDAEFELMVEQANALGEALDSGVSVESLMTVLDDDWSRIYRLMQISRRLTE